MTANSVDMLKCPDCDHIYDEVEAVTLYECGDCGTIFDRDGSADGCSHRCPDCNKFAAKMTTEGCPECTAAEGEHILAHEGESGEWVDAADDPDDPDEDLLPGQCPECKALSDLGWQTHTPDCSKAPPPDDDDPMPAPIPGFRTCGGCGRRYETLQASCAACGWAAYDPVTPKGA